VSLNFHCAYCNLFRDAPVGGISFLTDILKSVIFLGLGLIFAGASCSSSSTLHERTHFSRTDSLTDVYLVLQDSLLQSWNRVMRIELDRTEVLQDMLNGLQHTTVISDEQWAIYNGNLEQLERIRFTQKSMSDPHVIEEYDKACAELTKQLTLLSVTSAQLQSAAEQLADYNASNAQYRRYYDSLAHQFNSFVELNSVDLSLDSNLQLEQKPLFWSVSNH
jgi:hypothetical protein